MWIVPWFIFVKKKSKTKFIFFKILFIFYNYTVFSYSVDLTLLYLVSFFPFLLSLVLINHNFHMRTQEASVLFYVLKRFDRVLFVLMLATDA